MHDEVTRAAAAAVAAEVVWLANDRGGAEGPEPPSPTGGAGGRMPPSPSRLGWAVVTPLVAEGAVVVAAPFAAGGLPGALAVADAVTLVLSDARLAGPAWQPLAVPVAAAVTDDPDGDRFLDGLVEQEVRKHPPSRARLDSPLLRREHWWEVPRRLVSLTPTGPPAAVGARDPAVDGVLAVAVGDGLHVDTVAVDDWDVPRPSLRSLAGRASADGDALLGTWDESRPDRERSTTLALTGHLAGGRLQVADRAGSRTLPPPLGLVARLREESARKRACRDALRAAGR